jgi:hypothetical protein
MKQQDVIGFGSLADWLTFHRYLVSEEFHSISAPANAAFEAPLKQLGFLFLVVFGNNHPSKSSSLIIIWSYLSWKILNLVLHFAQASNSHEEFFASKTYSLFCLHTLTLLRSFPYSHVKVEHFLRPIRPVQYSMRKIDSTQHLSHAASRRFPQNRKGRRAGCDCETLLWLDVLWAMCSD